MELSIFDDNDWNHFHDVIFGLTSKSLNRRELEWLFVNYLTEDLRQDAYQWGMNDTPWRDDVYEFIEKNGLPK